MPDFMIFALIAGISLTLVAGPLGSLVLWRKMAYFGDTLSHAAMLGIAGGVLLQLNLHLAILCCCLLCAAVLALIQPKSQLAFDTLLGILSPSALALSLVMLSFMPDIRADMLIGYLFGDLLAITKNEVVLISICASLVLIMIISLWNKLIAVCIDRELAQAEGLAISHLQLILMLLIAVIIAVAMKVVGVLLITALLVIPAATAKNFSKTPEQMAVLASIIGNLCVGLGLITSWYFDTPAGPSVVSCAFAIFVMSLSFKIIQR